MTFFALKFSIYWRSSVYVNLKYAFLYFRSGSLPKHLCCYVSVAHWYRVFSDIRMLWLAYGFLKRSTLRKSETSCSTHSITPLYDGTSGLRVSRTECPVFQSIACLPLVTEVFLQFIGVFCLHLARILSAAAILGGWTTNLKPSGIWVIRNCTTISRRSSGVSWNAIPRF